MRGLMVMPLEESPWPTRCECASHTFSGSRPSHAAFTSSCVMSRRGRPVRHGFQSPDSGQRRQAASAPAPARPAAPQRKALFLFRKSGGPVLDIALQHLVLEILLFENRLGHVAERDHA